MYKLAIGIAFGLLLFNGSAMAACSIPNTLTNGTTADATAVMGNFTSLAGCTAPLAAPAFTGNVAITGSGSGIALDVQAPGNTLIRSKASSAGGAYVAIDRYLNSASYGAGIVFYSGGSPDFGLGVNSGGGPSDGLNIYSYGTGSNVFLIDKASGNVGIHTASPSYTLHVNGSVAGTSAYNNLSDARLKKNLVPLVGGLALISQLQPVRFEWRSEDEREVGKEFNLPAGRQIGFIAQDVAKILPEATSTAKGKDAIMSVAESKVVPVLVAAVKELKAANDNQAVEIGKLRAQMVAVRGLKDAGGNQSAKIEWLEDQVVALRRKVNMQTAAR